MKKVGYRAEEAGGIEAAASTGGQILPPIMGAGAFLMAEYTGLPYLEIVKAAVIPAILYMGTVFVFVHLVAVRRDLRGIPAAELPSFGRTLAKGWHFLLALVVLMVALLMDFSVARVGFLACVAIAVLAAQASQGLHSRIPCLTDPWSAGSVAGSSAWWTPPSSEPETPSLSAWRVRWRESSWASSALPVSA